MIISGCDDRNTSPPAPNVTDGCWPTLFGNDSTLSLLSLCHSQYQQEIGAKKRNRWENVAAVQEPRKLYFRLAPRPQKQKYVLFYLKNFQFELKIVSESLSGMSLCQTLLLILMHPWRRQKNSKGFRLWEITHINVLAKIIGSDNLRPDTSTKNFAQVFWSKISPRTG